MDFETLPLPPIIADMIAKLNKQGTGAMESENLANTLEMISNACTAATGRYRTKQAKALDSAAQNRKIGNRMKNTRV